MLAVRRWGAEGAPPVLALHGITANSGSWQAVARALGDDARLIVPDLRGRAGSSELEGPYGIERHAADALAVLDAEGLDRAVVAGHSMGAYVAARLAADHPDRVQALVLVDGGLALPVPPRDGPRHRAQGHARTRPRPALDDISRLRRPPGLLA